MIEASLWIGTSWTLNKTLAEGLALAHTLAKANGARDTRISAFTCLREVALAPEGSSGKVGAQKLHGVDAGA